MNKFIKSFAAICLVLATAACSDTEEKRFEQSSRMITNTYLASVMTVYPGQTFYVSGQGFTQGDRLSFRAGDRTVTAALTDIAAKVASFVIPESLTKGSYAVYIERGEATQFLTTVKVYLTTDFDVPDREGATIKGAVVCENRGIPGVRVSDGLTTTQTDENGYYWLTSDKSTGYVFCSFPSGYVPVDLDAESMGFWQPLTTAPSLLEQHNFSLQSVDNGKFVLLVGADLHLANKQNDIQAFKNGFIADSRALISTLDCPAYCMFAGDMTWDRYWYDNKFTFPVYRQLLSEVNYPVPIFHSMGNHDNDPYVMGDEAGQQPFRKELGPNYYSFDLGNAHIVVLDDIDWVNTGGAQGTVGSRNHNNMVSLQQIEWLKEDLSVLDKSKPLFIVLHVPLYNNYNTSFSNTVNMTNSAGGTQVLMNAVNGFERVHFVSGHTHKNATMVLSSKVFEHNVAAVCETWWWSTYYSGRGICTDGTPAGYAVFTVDGDHVEWSYKCIGADASKQFHAYDMNKVKEILSTDDAKRKLAQFPSRTNGGDDYGDVGPNEVFINVWNYDPLWKIEVKENGKALDVKRVYQRDPLHSLAFDLPRIEKNGTPNSDWASLCSAHMFSVTASAPDTQLEITVTDRFGNTYAETMTRPKTFHVNMQ